MKYSINLGKCPCCRKDGTISGSHTLS
ncbi:hypothetical protein LINPERHAP1_LOCUS5338 [Linum perenne]